MAYSLGPVRMSVPVKQKRPPKGGRRPGDTLPGGAYHLQFAHNGAVRQQFLLTALLVNRG